MKDYLEHEGFASTLFALDKQNGLEPEVQEKDRGGDPHYQSEESSNHIGRFDGKRKNKRTFSMMDNSYFSTKDKAEEDPQQANGRTQRMDSQFSEFDYSLIQDQRSRATSMLPN